ncbi:MAG: SET domain-containing protein-lysine N-methyltransferase [Acidobacteriota bacterium]|nr:SET domain-containing protein-lysine N-methyltransferase [Acidobacteriota bacterium]
MKQDEQDNLNHDITSNELKAVKRILNVTEDLGLFYDPANGHHAIRALQHLPLNSVLHRFSAREYVARPTYLSVQVADDRHIHLAPEFLQYINHSCEPNTFFDTRNGEVVALRDIASNEEISFFYPSTEWSMTQSFTCFCGAASCLGQIQGAVHLPKQTLTKYRFAEHIHQQLQRVFGAYWKTTRELRSGASAQLRLAGLPAFSQASV